jgi:hypothetical protein
LVDSSLVDLRSLGDEVRFRIFDYLWGRGVRSSELGVDPTYANKIKNAGLGSLMLCLRGCRELPGERELKSLSPVYGRQEVKLNGIQPGRLAITYTLPG